MNSNKLRPSIKLNAAEELLTPSTILNLARLKISVSLNIFYSAAINEHAAAAAVRKQSMLFTKWEPCEKKVKYRKPVKKE